MLSCKVGEKIIYAIGSKNREILKKYSQKGILRCPICDGEMQFRAGKIKVWHFAHKTKCKCESEKFEDETKEHYDGKKLLYIWFKLQPNIEKVELEKWLPNIRLRPDLFVIDKKGKKYCIEYQCTPITQEQKDYKSELYELNDMIPVWIFGVERIGEKSKVASQYRLDPSNKLFYKRGFTQKIKKKNENFYFEDGEFYLNEEINFNFRNKLQSLKIQHRLEKEREKERRNKQYNELLKQQKLIYRKVLEEIHTDQKEQKIKERYERIKSLLNYDGDIEDLQNFEIIYGNIYKWISYIKNQKDMQFVFLYGNLSYKQEDEIYERFDIYGTNWLECDYVEYYFSIGTRFNINDFGRYRRKQNILIKRTKNEYDYDVLFEKVFSYISTLTNTKYKIFRFLGDGEDDEIYEF